MSLDAVSPYQFKKVMPDIYDVHHAETGERLGGVSKHESGWKAYVGGRRYGPFKTKREAGSEVWIQRD